MISKERMAACKAYLRVDYNEDDKTISMLLNAADQYLAGAGITREIDPSMFDLITFDLALRTYDGRDMDAAHAATTPIVRYMIQQLKLRAAFASASASPETPDESDTMGEPEKPEEDNHAPGG